MQYGLNLHTGAPLRGRLLAQLRDFLAKSGLRYDEGIEFSAVIQNAEGAIVASASLQEGVIKCVAVDPAMQGEGLTATLLTAVRQEAMQRGHRRLFLYTKPENRMLFAPLGFHAVAATANVLLMEDRPGGFAAWAESIRAPAAHGTVGSIVMNCNPMTNGHRYLIETAAAQCDFLYLFILSEDKSAVPTADRLRLVRETLRGCENIAVAETGRYLISSATFPDYFLKDASRADAVWCELDLAVFARLANMLGITRRFAGTEPLCPVTAAYNRAMAEALPRAGIEFIEIPRLSCGEEPVSASRVRRLFAEGRLAEIEPLVPPATFAYLSNPETRETLRL